MPLPDEPTSEELMAKHGVDSPDQAHEMERREKAAAAEQDEAEVERRTRRGELARHPHTQLRGILADLRSPAAISGDITTKLATLHAGVVRLASLIIAATPPPEDSEEKINEDFERKQQPAEGAHEQEPVG